MRPDSSIPLVLDETLNGPKLAARFALNCSRAWFPLQGFGNVGSYAAEFFSTLGGAKVIAVIEHDCTVVNKDGLDIAALTAYVRPVWLTAAVFFLFHVPVPCP